MNKHPSVLFAALLVAACASAGQGPFAEGGGTTLQLIVENQTLDVVTAWADWGTGGRTRLDELSAGERRTFTVPVEGQLLRVEFALIGRRPVGLTDRAQARPGDTYEWVLRSNGTVFYRLVR